MTFSWLKAVALGILLWMVVFTVVSGLVAFKTYDSGWVQLAVAVFAGIIAFVATPLVRPKTAGTALAYGLVWALSGLTLDVIISMQFNRAIFLEWSLWLSYLLVVVAPWAQFETSSGSASLPRPQS